MTERVVSARGSAASTLGPAGLAVLLARLTGIADEMGAALRRAAFSPNIKERADCSAALFTATGDLLVQAEHIPVHLGSMPASVRAAIDRVGDPGPGAHVIVNDPFAGGTHLNDITLVTPCHLDGRLVGWAANRAHHADLGGAAPGSMPADAVEIQQEGLRIPPSCSTPGCAPSCSPAVARLSSGPATSTPRSVPTWSAPPASPTYWPRAPPSTRSSPTASAVWRPPSTRSPTAPGPPPTSSTRPDRRRPCAADQLAPFYADLRHRPHLDFTGSDPSSSATSTPSRP